MNAITEWKFFTGVRPTLDAMYEDCLNARKTIDFEQYILDYDDTGKRFIELLKEKARQGIRVRILVDMVGAIGLYLSPAVQELRDAGAQVLFFHPISLWRVHNFTSWYLRDHRKILIVDSETGYIGGVGVNEEMMNYRDTQVRFKGEAVSRLEYVFNRMWENTLTRRFFPFLRQMFTVDSTTIATNSPHRRQRFIYWQFVDMMRQAKKYIYITTPYFVPDRRIMRVIRLAAERGVDVRLLLPGISDVRIVSIASRSYYKQLLKSGVRIFQYEKAVLHAKTMVIDDTWGTVGSTNLDNLSLSFNYEANLSTSETKFIEDIKIDFNKDLEVSRELKIDDLEALPLWSRLVGLLIRPFHKFL